MSDSLLGWASTAELRLGELLNDQSYFPDAGLSPDVLDRYERFFGIFLSRQLAAGADLAELLAVTPSLTVTSLITHASRKAVPTAVAEEEGEADAFFAEYLAGLGIDPSADNQAEIRHLVEPLLDRTGLDVPDGTEDPVCELGYQACICAAEIPAFLELCDAFDTDGSTAPETIVDALTPDSDWAPTLPMLTAVAAFGRERLVQLTAGIQALRAFSVEDPSSWVDRVQQLGQLEPQLPAMLQAEVVAELRERPVGTEERETAVGVATRELRPRLILDTFRGRVCVRLPEQRVAQPIGAPEHEAEVLWRVSVEGTTRQFRTARPWGEETYAEALDVALEHQVRSASVMDVTNSITWDVPVVETEDPVLIFASNGQNVTDKASLHHSTLWVITPADATLFDVVRSENLPVIETLEIQGWDGWTARKIDASASASLQVVRPGQQPGPNDTVRSIDPRQRVRFIHPEPPVRGVRTHGRLEVHAASLIAEFPPTVSGRDEHWTLSISAYAGIGEPAEEIAEPEILEVPADGGAFVLFDPEAYEDPWVGEYLVRVKGPRNESFRHRYGLVEGMTVTTELEGQSTSVRIPREGGLSPATMRVYSGEKPFTAQPARVTVPSDQAHAQVVISTEAGDSLPLTYTPPALQFELPLVTYPPTWRVSRLYMGSRDLDPTGDIRVRAHNALGKPRVTLRNHHGSPVRTIALKPEDPITFSCPTAEIAKSAAILPQGRLDLEWDDVESRNRVSVALALISSTPHATEAIIDGGDVTFPDLAPDRELAAWVWPATAPWAAARTLPRITERTELPEDLVNAGDLTIQLHSADPFSTLRSPQEPAASAVTAHQDGYFKNQGASLTQLSAFLGGEAEAAPDSPEILPILWDHCGSTENQRAVAQAVFAENPTAALQALSTSLVPLELQPGRIISSGLIHQKFDAPAQGAELTSDWIRALVILSDIDAELTAAGEEGRTPDVKALLDDLRSVAGQRAVDTLLTGRDATLDTAVIDSSTVRIAHMDQAQQDQLMAMFFANADIVPGPILDDNARLIGVLDTFKKRVQLNSVVATEGLIAPAVSLLRALRSNNRGLYAAARVRFDKLDGVNTEDKANAWALTPVVSLVFALSARMNAHGMMGKSTTLENAAAGWSHIADIVPELVTADVVSAEAMVIAVRHSARG
ncbi:hypothetical protein [Corynebacterium renale]|uniref:Uncharacterized protein n=1 Tax=Corynebacterium renale TaxID=1724 RepID=A0A2A9DQM6_9CORY|nr:hypothetical protein [Corynebacterium renale]PFG28475.1 hypothetical protein ATK06_1586 [Corynebacterium renale]SQI26345.1 Uncharacterised protein [Corynebacterium renale]